MTSGGIAEPLAVFRRGAIRDAAKQRERVTPRPAGCAEHGRHSPIDQPALIGLGHPRSSLGISIVSGVRPRGRCRGLRPLLEVSKLIERRFGQLEAFRRVENRARSARSARPTMSSMPFTLQLEIIIVSNVASIVSNAASADPADITSRLRPTLHSVPALRIQLRAAQPERRVDPVKMNLGANVNLDLLGDPQPGSTLIPDTR